MEFTPLSPSIKSSILEVLSQLMFLMCGTGIMPVHVPHVWNLKIPPRVQFFLCLLSKSKVLTRDNLSVRRKVDDMSCLFCEENEHVGYLFFDCVVAM